VQHSCGVALFFVMPRYIATSTQIMNFFGRTAGQGQVLTEDLVIHAADTSVLSACAVVAVAAAGRWFVGQFCEAATAAEVSNSTGRQLRAV